MGSFADGAGKQHGFLRGTAAGHPVSDNFDGSFLDTQLRIPEAPARRDVRLSEGHAFLHVPGGSAHDAWAPLNRSARLMQVGGNLDFYLIAKFDSFPDRDIQMQGILVEESPTNYLRFHVYHNGTTNLFCAAISGNSYRILLNGPLPLAKAPYYLRVFRIDSE
jgi:hypothetical protein